MSKSSGLTEAIFPLSSKEEHQRAFAGDVSCDTDGGIQMSGNYKHGHSPKHKPSLTYTSWGKMKDRCYNSNHVYYRFYGGRGIKICDRWLSKDGFANFLSDMGERPSRYHSIDRYPDKDGNYEPSNCRWATTSEQKKNRNTLSSHKKYPAFGKSLTAGEWSRETGVKVATFLVRIRKGWTTEEALLRKPWQRKI